MTPIKKILAPTDLSEFSQAGIGYALSLARSFGAEVTVYHVVDRDEIAHYRAHLAGKGLGLPASRQAPNLIDTYQKALDRFVGQTFSEILPLVEVRKVVEIGKPFKNIVERAQIDGVDVIVMSTHGRAGLAHMLIGSVTEKVVRLATCPVLSIHPKPEGMTAKTVAAAS